MITLDVQKRDPKTSLGDIRKSGNMPAVFYGKKQPSTAIQLPLIAFEKALKEAGESTVLHLKGTGIDVDVLIHEVDLNPLTDKPRHADFYAIDATQKLSVHVPLEFIGVSPAVKDLGAVFVKVMHEVEVKALAKDLPHNLEVDISKIAGFHDVVTIADIKVPAGVEIEARPEDVVASVYEPKEEVEAAPLDLSAIEVEKKGKEAKEGAEGAAAEAPAK